MTPAADLFAPPEPDAVEFVFVPDRRYQLKPATLGGEPRVVVAWHAATPSGQLRPDGPCGVLGGYHADQHAALAAIDRAEDARKDPFA